MMIEKIRALKPGGALLLVVPTANDVSALVRLTNEIGIKAVTVKGPKDPAHEELASSALQVLVVDPKAGDLTRALRQLGRTRNVVHVMMAMPRVEAVMTEHEVFIPRGSLAHTLETAVPEPTTESSDPVEAENGAFITAMTARTAALDEDALRRMLDSGIVG